MNVLEIEKLNQLISRTDMSGNEKVEWLVDFIEGAKLQQEQAKEMEKQQIIDAYDQGSEAGYELAKNDDIYEGYKTKEAEQYYNETFS